MKNYLANLHFFLFVLIGRKPIVPYFNKQLEKWQTCRLYLLICYRKALKQQIDLDLGYSANKTNEAEIRQEIRQIYNNQLEIKWFEQQISNWQKWIVQKSVERYYKKEKKWQHG